MERGEALLISRFRYVILLYLLIGLGMLFCLMDVGRSAISIYLPHTASATYKQAGVAAWLECWISHLGVAGSSPGHDNL